MWTGLVVSQSKNILVVSELDGNRIRKINLQTKQVSHISGPACTVAVDREVVNVCVPRCLEGQCCQWRLNEDGISTSTCTHGSGTQFGYVSSPGLLRAFRLILAIELKSLLYACVALYLLFFDIADCTMSRADTAGLRNADAGEGTKALFDRPRGLSLHPSETFVVVADSGNDVSQVCS